MLPTPETPGIIIDGRAAAAEIKAVLKARLTRYLAAAPLRLPQLAVVLAGDDPASQIYVRNKQRACEELGFKTRPVMLSASISQQALEQEVRACVADPEVDGVLVQLPLPPGLDATRIIELIRPDKDVDGFHPYNVGRLAQRVPALRACTPWGIMVLLHRTLGPDLRGRHAVIVGASNIVGRPVALELLLAGCTVTVAHRFTPAGELPRLIGEADILVAACGKPKLIEGAWLKPGATAIDVGITRLPDGRLSGDLDFESARQRAGAITPVPGGVGPMTVAMLMANTLRAWEYHVSRQWQEEGRTPPLATLLQAAPPTPSAAASWLWPELAPL